MCDSVSYVLGHVFARQSHLTTSIVEWAVDFCEDTFFFYMVFYHLPFKRSLSTFVGACDWKLLALMVVMFSHIFKSGFIFMTVFTGVRSLMTYPLLMCSDMATLEALPTPMLALYFHKLTPNQPVLWRWISIQVLFILSKFPLPITASLFRSAPNLQFFQRPLQFIISQVGEFGFITHRTWLVVFLDLLDAFTTYLSSTRTTDEAWLFQDLQTNGAIGWKPTGWWRHKLAVVAPMVDPTWMWNTPSHSPFSLPQLHIANIMGDYIASGTPSKKIYKYHQKVPAHEIC